MIKIITIQKMKGESEEKYDDFCVYANAPPSERSVGYVVENKYGFSKGTPEYQKKLYSLKKICTKRCWVQRAEISDKLKRVEDLKKRADKSDELNQLILEIVEEELYSIKDMLSSVNSALTNKGSHYSLASRADIKRMLILCLKYLNDVWRLACGLSTTNNDVNLSGFIGVNVTDDDEDEKLIYSKEVREMIQNIGDEPDSETQKFLDEVL